MSWTITPSFTQWTPALISTALWLDAADASTITTVSGAVSQWNDKSGNNRSVTQGTAANRPTVSGGGILFDGTNDKLVSEGVFTGDKFSAFLVANADSASINSDGRAWFTLRPNNTGAVNGFMHLIYRNNISNFVRYVRTSDADAADAASGFLVNEYTFPVKSIFECLSANDFRFYYNGAQQGATQSITNSFAASGARIELGDYFGSPGYFLKGTIFEFIFVAGSVADATRQRIEGYLAHKWGLTANLPNDHPYKVNPPAP